MTELKLKHLTPYLPYGLKLQHNNGIIKPFYGISEQYKDGTFMLYWPENDGTINASSNYKPILHPLSDLTKEITVNGETFVPMKRFFSMKSKDWDKCNRKKVMKKSFIRDLKNGDLPYMYIEQLHKWKFDVSGLIELGLAISVTNLEANPYE